MVGNCTRPFRLCLEWTDAPWRSTRPLIVPALSVLHGLFMLFKPAFMLFNAAVKCMLFIWV